MIGKWFRKKQKPDIEFVDVSRKAYTYNPIQMAKDVPTHFTEHQIKKYGSFKFPHCPGMIDLKNYGYIIPAWDDIHIMANRAGTMAVVGGSNDKRPTPFPPAGKMSTDIGDGIFEPKGVPYEVLHIGSPWKIMANNKMMSVLALPAFYHSTFLDDIYVYPGIVDYGKFCDVNLICSAKRPCNITIKAGEPLLHIIPFHGQEIVGGYGPATEFHEDQASSFVSTSKQFYRKLCQVFKPTTLTKIEEDNTDENIC